MNVGVNGHNYIPEPTKAGCLAAVVVDRSPGKLHRLVNAAPDDKGSS